MAKRQAQSTALVRHDVSRLTGDDLTPRHPQGLEQSDLTAAALRLDADRAGEDREAGDRRESAQTAHPPADALEQRYHLV